VEEHILILAPRGRDASVICQVLGRDGTACHCCNNLSDLTRSLDEVAGGIIITEEALAGADVEQLLRWCENQPPWSDIPIIVLASKQTGKRPLGSSNVLQRLGNVVLLERPINAETLVSAARATLRARRRQYQTRKLLNDKERAATELRILNETLEQRVEERARELDGARESLALAQDFAGMGSWELDLVTDTSRRSAQYDQIFGYSEQQATWGQTHFLSHVVEEDQASVREAFARAAEGGALDLECRIRRLDGAIRWIVARGRAAEFAPDGRPLRMAGVIMDTTDRRQTEEALRQAQKMEAIGQLTGGVAHDFNNLLTVIVGGLDMMIRRPDNTERVVRLANAAMTAARRGEQLTQQLLAFSRRQMLRPETVDPNRLLMDFEPLARRAVGESIMLDFDLAPEVTPIKIDPAQFEAAVLNLIVNARDAMPDGGTVTVRSRNFHQTADATPENGGLKPGDYVEIAVVDRGDGIEAGTLARVFEPFFTTKDVGKGSGLGLAQVYGFARSAGGSAAIQSEVGSGTVVRLYIPVSDGVVAEDPRASPDVAPLEPAASGETLLIVEDDEQVLGMAVESLQELRYQVIVSRNGKEALERLRGSGRIDIMFSDVVMPGGISGLQLAAEARRIRPELKILLTSGYTGGPGKSQIIDVDLPVLDKPYGRDELAQKLRAVLDGG
jgi:PAS domain S-box-containing protein